MLMLDHALPGIPGGPGGPGGPTMPLYSDPGTPKKSTESVGGLGQGLCLPPPATWTGGPLPSLTLEQGDELLVGCSWQAGWSRGTRKPNTDSRT